MKIFSEETIYHLGDRYVEYIKDYKKKKQDEFKNIAVFPSRLKIIPTVSLIYNAEMASCRGLLAILCMILGSFRDFSYNGTDCQITQLTHGTEIITQGKNTSNTGQEIIAYYDITRSNFKFQ